MKIAIGMPLAIGLLFFLLIGCVAGFLSGLLGVGGGVIVVPALRWVFKYYHPLAIPADRIMHIAAGTSLAAMIVTSAAAVYSHQKHRNIDWRMWLRLLPGSIIGVILGAWLASILPTHVLAIIFGVLLLLIAIHIFFTAKSKNQTNESDDNQEIKVHWILYLIASLAVGLSSGMLGIGGGSLIIPFLLLLRFPMNKVSGTSVAVILPLAIIGTIVFMITGNIYPGHIPYSTGFIYWPAFIGIAIGSVLLVSLGTWAGQHVNKTLLKRIFAVLLVLISIELFIG